MRSALRQMFSWLAGAALAAAVTASARADESRRVVVPGSAPADSSASKPNDDGLDLVGPTEAQKQRAKAAAEAKAKAEQEARLKAEAEARAKADAEARAKAEAERKVREEAEARARLEAERKAREEAARKAEEQRLAKLEEERKARLLAGERARAEQEAKARADEQARAQAAAEAKLREEIESRVRARVEAELRLQKNKEAKARTKAEAKAKAEAARKAKAEARAKAKAEARARREARRKGKGGDKPQTVPLPEVPAALVAEPQLAALEQGEPSKSRAEQARAIVTPAAVEPASAKLPGTQLAMAAQDPAEPEPERSRAIAIPHDEQARPRRQIGVDDALQVGPQGLVLNQLTASADLAPGSLPVRGTFAYRLATDDASALHHLFVLGAESARDAEGREPAFRWWGSAGLAPSASKSFGPARRNATTPDYLGWSAFVFSAGAGRTLAQPDGAAFGLSADAQLQGLSVTYRASTGPGQGPIKQVDSTLDQLRLRAASTAQSGRFTGLFQLGAYLYPGGGADALRSVPLRGALFDDDLYGLASAPQSFLVRAGGRAELAGQLTASLSYAYLGYSSSDWTSAHLVRAELNDRFGNLRAALGLTWQYDTPAVAAPGSGVGDYSSLFLTGSIGYAFY